MGAVRPSGTLTAAQKVLQQRWNFSEPLVHNDCTDFSLYRRLLGAVTRTDPGASRRAGGPEAQLRASMDHLHLNTLEEEELGGAAGLAQCSDGPRVEVKSRRRRKQ